MSVMLNTVYMNNGSIIWEKQPATKHLPNHSGFTVRQLVNTERTIDNYARNPQWKERVELRPSYIILTDQDTELFLSITG